MDISNVVVDISHHQQTVDFDLMKADGIVGVIHKATQGTRFIDPDYRERKRQAKDAGLLWGAYHFGTGSSGIDQADHFLEVARAEVDDLVVLDFEGNPQGASIGRIQARDFISSVHQSLDRFPGFYSGHFVKEDIAAHGFDQLYAECWLWLAQYGRTPVIPARGVWSTWTLWQYTDGAVGPEPHKVRGVGRCDRDKYHGSVEDLKRSWLLGHLQPGAAVLEPLPVA